VKKMSDTYPISVRGLSSGYNGIPLFSDLDLDLNEDDFLAIIGPNGGGKTTLFKTILGIVPPMAGSVKIFGEPAQIGIRHVGYVPQSSAFDSKYPISVEDVVLMGLRRMKGLRPFYSRQERELSWEAMEYVGICDLKDKSISELSGGQLQRVMIARALSSKPRILMLDEPTASLDPNMKDCAYDILKKVNRDGVAIMMITHDMANISGGVKRIAVMNRRLVCNDSPEITEEMVKIGFHCPPEFLRYGHAPPGDSECGCGCGRRSGE